MDKLKKVAINIAMVVAFAGFFFVFNKAKDFFFPGDPKEISDVSSSIIKVQDYNGGLVLYIKEDRLSTFSLVMQKAGQWQMKNDRSVAGMYFVQMVNTKDPYGNEGTENAITVFIKKDDLQRVNWKKIYAADLLNLVEIIDLPRFGKETSLEYCRDDGYLKQSPIFCQMVVAKIHLEARKNN